MKLRLSLLVAVGLLALTNPLRAEMVDQVIARARGFLGNESALNAVSTIHLTGILETMAQVPSPEDKTKLVDQLIRLPIEIVFQKNYRQRITLTYPKVIETTALDNYDAWQKRSNPLNLSQWQVTLLDAGQVKRLRANTWENLNFFAGLEKKGGSVQYAGEAMVDGQACLKLSFAHAENIIFIRYFDKVTGRLIKTETENGTEIREAGELIAEGVRFPQKVSNKSATGAVTTITFEKVRINESFPASDFAVPAFKTN